MHLVRLPEISPAKRTLAQASKLCKGSLDETRWDGKEELITRNFSAECKIYEKLRQVQ